MVNKYYCNVDYTYKCKNDNKERSLTNAACFSDIFSSATIEYIKVIPKDFNTKEDIINYINVLNKIINRISYDEQENIIIVKPKTNIELKFLLTAVRYLWEFDSSCSYACISKYTVYLYNTYKITPLNALIISHLCCNHVYGVHAIINSDRSFIKKKDFFKAIKEVNIKHLNSTMNNISKSINRIENINKDTGKICKNLEENCKILESHFNLKKR
jgi:thiaminase